MGAFLISREKCNEGRGLGCGGPGSFTVTVQHFINGSSKQKKFYENLIDFTKIDIKKVNSGMYNKHIYYNHYDDRKSDDTTWSITVESLITLLEVSFTPLEASLMMFMVQG